MLKAAKERLQLEDDPGEMAVAQARQLLEVVEEKARSELFFGRCFFGENIWEIFFGSCFSGDFECFFWLFFGRLGCSKMVFLQETGGISSKMMGDGNLRCSWVFPVGFKKGS